MLCQQKSMLYYRYRPVSEMSFKELLYSEIYFTTTEECNDPCDSKSFYEFSADNERWVNLFELAVGNLNQLFPDISTQLAESLCRRCPITFDEAMSLDYWEILDQETKICDPFLKNVVIQNITRIYELYKPESRYFASFSKESTEPLMWAHYGSRHEGYCLIFRSINGFLLQNPSASKTSVCRKTPNSFSPTISNSIPDKFAFRDIEYENTVSHLNAFDLFPQSIAMKSLSEGERITLCTKQESQYFVKHSSWSYEKEARVTLRAPLSWLFGERIDYSNQERLFHYEPSQLVGVIFGARMPHSNRARIIEIITERSDRISRQTNYKRILFDFLLQEARLSSRHRSIDINPIGFLGNGGTCKPNEKEFELKLERWNRGEGIEIDGNRATRVTVMI